jgi:phosphatidylglycerophosphate synthase
MPTEPYIPTDRRPIASRESLFWQKTAAFLAGHGVSANGISIAGMLAALCAGACLAATPFLGELGRICWFIAALGSQLRLIANLLDGMVAIAAGRASAVGELFNEMPDRVSDAAILIGAGYAAGGDPVAGYVAACLAIMTAYIRAVGKASGVTHLFLGPMAKQHRMAVITVACVLMALCPTHLLPSYRGMGIISAALLIIIVGSIVTCVRRISRIAEVLKGTA